MSGIETYTNTKNAYMVNLILGRRSPLARRSASVVGSGMYERVDLRPHGLEGRVLLDLSNESGFVPYHICTGRVQTWEADPVVKALTRG
jgi:hypothetical protein